MQVLHVGPLLGWSVLFSRLSVQQVVYLEGRFLSETSFLFFWTESGSGLGVFILRSCLGAGRRRFDVIFTAERVIFQVLLVSLDLLFLRLVLFV